MKYGCITGVHRSTMMKFAASQKFLRSMGGAFVKKNASGFMEIALTADTTIYGYCVIPQNYISAGTSSTIFETSATAGADELPVITNKDAEFLVKADATVTQAMVGDLCDLIGVNDGTAQLADVGTASTNILQIVQLGTDVGGSADSVVVKFNPTKVVG